MVKMQTRGLQYPRQAKNKRSLHVYLGSESFDELIFCFHVTFEMSISITETVFFALISQFYIDFLNTSLASTDS